MVKNHRRFSREFKVENVRMLNEGNRSISEGARDLDLHTNVPGRWKRQLSTDARNAPSQTRARSRSGTRS